MKKTMFVLLCLFLTTLCFADSYSIENKLGIGISNPTQALEVNGSILGGEVTDTDEGKFFTKWYIFEKDKLELGWVNSGTAYHTGFYLDDLSGNVFFRSFTTDIGGNGPDLSHYIMLSSNGLGIDTQDFPDDCRIAVKGNIAIGDYTGNSIATTSNFWNQIEKDKMVFNWKEGTTIKSEGFYLDKENGSINFRYIEQNLLGNIYSKKFDITSIYFSPQGIGVKTDKLPVGCALAVNGTIYATEIKVKNYNTTTGWPDYVFKPNYDLKTLNEVDHYIKKNGHLPEMPSAKQINEEGVSIGEMQAKLLQKIEELTLYMIEMKKENEVLKKEIDQLKK